MTTPLDEKGRSARNGLPCCKDIPNSGRAETDAACSLCSATALPDGMEELDGRLTAFAGITPDHPSGGSFLNDAARDLVLEAQSALASQKAISEALDEEVRVAMRSMADQRDRADTLEAQVQRLTEDNEALRRKLDMHEAALSFVHRWAVQKERNGTSAAERLSAIAHHPSIATLNSRENKD